MLWLLAMEVQDKLWIGTHHEDMDNFKNVEHETCEGTNVKVQI